MYLITKVFEYFIKLGVLKLKRYIIFPSNIKELFAAEKYVIGLN